MASGPMGIHAEVILGLDPGRDKIGFAFVGRDGALLLSGIFPSRERDAFWAAVKGESAARFMPWLRESPIPFPVQGRPFRVVVGNGTYGDTLLAEAREQVSCEVVEVDERGTTLEARDLYWRLHRPAWWRRFLPRGLWGSPRPLDDLAAWAIALRSFDV